MELVIFFISLPISTYAVSDEQNGHSNLVLVSDQAEVLFQAIETGIADTDYSFISIRLLKLSELILPLSMKFMR